MDWQQTLQAFTEVYNQNFNSSIELQKEIIPAGELTPIQALKVYREGYEARCLDILESNYPRTKQLMGKRKFEKVCMSFIYECPSTVFDLSQFGRDFPHFLKQLPRIKQVVYEMAQLESYEDELFFSPTGVFNDQEKLKTGNFSTTDGLEFNSCFLFRSNFDLREVVPCKGEFYFILYKNHHQQVLKSLSRGQFQLLEYLKQGMGLEPAIELSANLESEDIAVFFQELLLTNLFYSFKSIA